MTTALDVETQVVPLSELSHRSAEVLEVAAQVFAQPPWREGAGGLARFADRLHTDADDHRSIAALTTRHGALVGFSWLRQGREYATLLGRAADPPSTELVELAVLPEARGQGLGAALHDALLPSLDAAPALLVTHPRARPAMGLYRRRGWSVVGTVPSADGLRAVLRRHPR